MSESKLPQTDVASESTSASTSPRTPSSHLAARASIIASLICFTGNCLANKAALRMELADGQWFGDVMSYLTSGIVLMGIVLGIVGLVGGIRRKSSDTIGVAVIGLSLNLAIVALTIWALRVLSDAGLR